MSRIFLSHSGEDKDFAKRLAANLLCEGFSVWLDSLESEQGYSLLDGIRRSDFLLAILTPNALASARILEELKAARRREEREGRKFIVPVLVNSVGLPDFLAERMCVEFADSFARSLVSLCESLREKVEESEEDGQIRPAVPLVIDRGTELDRYLLKRRIRTLTPTDTDNITFASSDMWDVQDRFYTRLRRSLFVAADEPQRVRAGSWLEPPEAERCVADRESALKSGMARILNRAIAFPNETGGLLEAAYWYTRAVRWEILYYLGEYGRFGSEEPGFYPLVHFESAPFGSTRSVRRFYEIDEETTLEVWREGDRFPFQTWADQGLRVVAELGSLLGPNEPLRAHWDRTFVYRYLIPQWLFQSEVRGGEAPVIWEPSDDLRIRIA